MLMVSETQILNRKGRKRKSGKRHPSGKLMQKLVPQVAPAVIYYSRTTKLAAAGVPYENPLDYRGGFTLGQLRLIGLRNESKALEVEHDHRGITERQFNIGQSWALLCVRHAKVMGYSLGVLKSPPLMKVSPGEDCSPEPSEKHIMDLRQKWRDCYRILIDVGVSFVQGGAKMKLNGTEVAMACWDICVANKPLDRIRESEFGYLKLGLNALGRVVK